MDCRISDHILTLRAIVDKYTQNKKKLYACFINFKKAFDSIWREGLIYKSLKKGVGGLFRKIIQNIYVDTEVAIKLADGITPAFSPGELTVLKEYEIITSIYKIKTGRLYLLCFCAPEDIIL